MTDLEMTRMCAEAMRLRGEVAGIGGKLANGAPPAFWLDEGGVFDPLNDDAQAMALVKKIDLNIACDVQGNPAEDGWSVSLYDGSGEVFCTDLNRAIVECVAKMQKAKQCESQS